MATLSKPVGYECEFVDQVPEDYLCKQCNYVAREPTIASCCTEVLCKACIDAVIQDKKPCPSCENLSISVQGPQKKYQAKILDLNAHCMKKEHGCEWIGQLQHLDAHLHDCGYANIQCEQCNQDVQKHNVDTHLAEECPEREYMCKYCNFKATYHMVIDQHYEVCSYYPLVCPNRCGATFERGDLEDHMKMCPLQKVQCEFSYAGCQAKFIRNKQKDHMEQNTQKHLALMAAATWRISQEHQQCLEQLQATQNHLQLQQEALDRNQQEQQKTSATFIKHASGQLETQQEDIRKQQFQQEEFERNLQEQHNTTTAKFQRDVLEEVIPRQEQELDDKLQQQQRMYEERIAAVEQELHEKEQRLNNLQQAMDKRERTTWVMTTFIMIIGAVFLVILSASQVADLATQTSKNHSTLENTVQQNITDLSQQLSPIQVKLNQTIATEMIQLQSQMDDLNQELSSIPVKMNQILANLQNQTDDLNQELSSIPVKMNQTLASEMTKLQNQIDDSNQELTSIQVKMNQTLASEMTKLQNQIDDLNQTLVDTSLTQDKMTTHVETLNGTLVSKIRHLQDQIMYVHVQTLETITFTGYQGKKASNSNDHIDGPQMYTHPGGYKFELALCPKGIWSGAGTHVSVWVTSLNGDYDDKLKFPGRFLITVELVSEDKNQGNYKRTIKWMVFNPTEHNHGSGDQFIPHKELETHYLKNDLIKLRITNIFMIRNFQRSYANLSTDNSDSPPYDITFYKYQEAKEWGDFIDSPPMYTHPGGYKFKLRLLTKGVWDDYHTYMSVEVYSLRGDYDDKLKFTAKFTITIELVNQHRDQDHYTRDIRCGVTREGVGSLKYVGGVSVYISNTGLDWNDYKQTQYLKNNSFTIRVTKITLD